MTSTSNILALAVLLPLIGAMALLFRFRWSPRLVASALFAAEFSLALWVFIASWQQPIALALGGWRPPFGILLIGDTFSAVMLLTTAFVTALPHLSDTSEKISRQQLSFTQFLIAGVNLAFLTGDLFNLFVAFEIFLMASFVLLALSTEARLFPDYFPYLLINVLSSAIFFMCTGWIYRLVGNLNFGSIVKQVPALAHTTSFRIAIGVLLVLFLLKAAVAPFIYWLPKTYAALPNSLRIIMAGTLAEVGIYSIARTHVSMFGEISTLNSRALIAFAGLSVIICALLSLLDLPIIEKLCLMMMSQIGTIVAGIGLATIQSLTASVIYMLQHLFAFCALFCLIPAFLAPHTKPGKRISFILLVLGLTLVGFPPSGGFWGKWIIIQEALRNQQYWLVAALLIGTALIMANALKIGIDIFWVTAETSAEPSWTSLTPALIPTIFTIMIALWPQPFFQVAKKAADALIRPTAYATALDSTKGLKDIETR